MTGYLLDRNVLQELEDPHGNRNVHGWAANVRDLDMHVSVLTVMEARKGFDRARRELPAEIEETAPARIEAVFDRYLEALGERVLPVDRAIADRWGEMLARRDAHLIDTGLAATAAVRGLVLVTRNLRHMRGRGVPLLDPFRTRPRIEHPKEAG